MCHAIAVRRTATCLLSATLCSAEQEKKRKYSAAVEDRRASITHFVVSVDGALGHDAQHLMKRLCDQIAVKWEKSHSEVMCSCQNGFCYFACNKPLLAGIQGKMEKWTWHG